MPKIWQLSIIEFSKETIISGTILHSEKKQRNASKAIENAKYIIATYRKKTFSKKQIQIICGATELIATTDKSGYFSITTTKRLTTHPTILDCDSKKEIPYHQKYPSIFHDTSGKLSIISDIDETILHSYTKSATKRIYTTLFKPPHKRGVIDFTKDLFLAYQDAQPRFFYVSKSESNLFKIITEFLTTNKLPKGILFLTPYLNFKKLITNQKEVDFKKNTIEKIIQLSPKKEFILVGDDSQNDVRIYTEIAKKFTNQISYIFIRQTKKSLNSTKVKNWKSLQNTGVKVHYFKKNESFNPNVL